MINPAAQTFQDANELFNIMMGLYQGYLETLEAAAKLIPEDDTVRWGRMKELVDELNLSMEHDLGLFDKAITTDKESLHHYKDGQNIQALYDLLNKK